jgi:hypothetical protein
MNQKINTMKHITKCTYEKGNSFNGYRVSIQRKGVVFCKYIPAKKNWEAAEKKAIELEAYLAKNLQKCNSQDDAVQFYLKWRGK